MGKDVVNYSEIVLTQKKENLAICDTMNGS